MQNLMLQLWETLSEAATGYLPKLAGAIGILIAFWIGALILAAVVRAALKRTEIENKIFRWAVGSEGAGAIDSERWISRAVFYVVMLFGLIAFFNVLGLMLVTEPLNRMLGAIFEYLPRLLSAGLLLLLAFVVAGVLRIVLTKSLAAASLDERLGQTPAEREKRSISGTVATTLYWLILLLFLPLVLDALDLQQGLLEPLQGMLSRFLGFLPNLFAAGLILFFGWLAAKIVRHVVTNLLAAAGLDDAGRKTGVDTVLGKQTLSGLGGLLVYALILIPVAIASLDALQLGNIAQPAGEMLSRILDAIPALLTAVLIVGIAYLVGRFGAGLVSELLARLGFNNILGLLGLSKEPPEAGQRTPSEIVGYLILVIALFFAAIEAARQLGLHALSGLLLQFAEFAGHVLLGLVIFGVGLYLANLAANMIRSSRPQAGALLATAARVAILVLAVFMALREMGLAEQIINMTFGFVFGGLAVAAALAFGLGSRELAGRLVEGWMGHLKREADRGAGEP